MTKKQKEAFHQDIADLMAKYGVAGFVGMWFDGPGSEDMGFLKGYPMGDTVMKVCIEGITEKLKQFSDGLTKREPQGSIQVISGGNVLKN
jgi:hypothetical protein